MPRRFPAVLIPLRHLPLQTVQALFRHRLGGAPRVMYNRFNERGACANCGHDVVRVLETSETNRSLN